MRHFRSRGTVALLAMIAASVVVAMPTAPALAESRTGSPETTNGGVGSISVVSSTDIWAVGAQYGGGDTSPLVEHYDGTSWAVSPVPLPEGDGYGTFQAVDAISAGDVWAVGSAGVAGPDHTLAEHWNGTVWTIVPTSEPGNGILYSVAASSSHDVWAVGGNGGSVIEHWDGTQWSGVANADPPGALGAGLQSVTVSADGKVWAVGAFRKYRDCGCSGHYLTKTLVERLKGSTWQHLQPFKLKGSWDSQLHAVTSTPKGVVWAMGSAGKHRSGHAVPLIFRHTPAGGHTVEGRKVAHAQGTVLNGAASLADRDVWTSGYYLSGGAAHTLAEHWDGAKWRVVATPNLGGSCVLVGLDAVSSDDVWAAGYSNTAVQAPFVEHWDGSTWTLDPLA